MFSNKKLRAELTACAVSLTLTVLKAATAWWVGALALWASALDSLMDFFVSSINLFTLFVADRPADKEHPFGYGKAEAVAGLLQSILIVGSAVYLQAASLRRFLDPVPLEHLEGGIGVILGSAAIGFWLAQRLKKTAAATGSIVLKTDSLHYSMDLYTYGGLLLSFFLIRLTGWTVLDPLLTLAIAGYVTFLAVGTGRQAIGELMDREVHPAVRSRVEEIVRKHQPQVTGLHNFKSRQAASKMFLQFHIEMDKGLRFEEVHQLEERIAGEIRRELGNVHVTIHADPQGCGLDQTDLS